MVGVRSRRGCATCKKRKVKCDEKLPNCANCESRGVICPGYTTDVIFRDETTRISELYNNTDENSEWERPRRAFALRPSPATIQATLRSGKDYLATRLVATFYSNCPQSKRLDNAAGVFLPLIPARLGNSRALDDAVDCVIEAHHAFLCDRREMTTEICTKYGRALRSLKAAVESPKSSLTAETLCATQLLSVFEALTATSKAVYCVHSNAASRLVQARGPAAFKDPFSHAMLTTYRFPIWSSCLNRWDSCFLDDEAWLDIMSPTEFEANSNPYVGFSDSLFKAVIPLPELMRAFKHSHLNDDTHPDAPFLADKAYACKVKLLDAHCEWSQQFLRPHMWESSHESLPWTPGMVPRRYSDSRIAKMETIYWSTMLLTNRLIAYFSPTTPDSLAKESDGLASSICELYLATRYEDGGLENMWLYGPLLFAHFQFMSDPVKTAWIEDCITEIQNNLVFDANNRRWRPPQARSWWALFDGRHVNRVSTASEVSA